MASAGLTNLLHLSEVLHRASVENRLGVSGLLKWLGEQREPEGQVAEEHQLRLETDEKAVKLVTIHKSKGLEYSVVFCPFSWKGANIEHGGEEQVFFHEHGDGNLVRDLGSADYEAHKQQARVERLAENVRLLICGADARQAPLLLRLGRLPRRRDLGSGLAAAPAAQARA